MNGAPVKVARNSSATSTPTGIPGSAMTATISARIRSQAIITCRRGRRSAMPDRSSPPAKVGTMLAANAIAASREEPVWSNTSRVTATRASWSPATDSTWATHRAVNSRTPNTWANVDRCGGAVAGSAGWPPRVRGEISGSRLTIRSSLTPRETH